MNAVPIPRACRGCGCTDDNACWPPCFWVDQYWCSACEHRVGKRLAIIAVACAGIASALALIAGVVGSRGSFQSAIGLGICSLLSVGIALVLGHVGKRMLEASEL